MKNILLFSCLFIIIPFIIISLLISYPSNQEFSFTKNTMVKVYRSKTDKIEIVPLEEYVMGVVAGEMPASFNEEALKAQAVAARSYVMYKISKNKNKNYDVVDTVTNQVYLNDEELKKKWGKNYDKYVNKIKQAVNSTKGQILTYKQFLIQLINI